MCAAECLSANTSGASSQSNSGLAGAYNPHCAVHNKLPVPIVPPPRSLRPVGLNKTQQNHDSLTPAAPMGARPLALGHP